MTVGTLHREEEVINAFVDQLLAGGDGALLRDYCNEYPLLKESLEQKYRVVRALEEAFTEEDLAGTEIGEYLIIEEIGRGGMGVVYLALQQSLSRYVALKVLPLSFAMDAGSIKRFRSEAQVIARFNHPNIVPVYSMGKEKGIYYIAMALIPGISLNKVLDDLRHLPSDTWTATTVKDIIFTHPDFTRLNIGVDKTGKPDSIIVVRDPSFWNQPYPSFVLTLCSEIADALSYAHRNSVCHGDLKPSNIMLSCGGVPMIVDFGLAKDMRSLKVIQSEDFLGTVAYASPEQVEKNLISPKSDIWSLGVTMYEMLSLTQPFRSGDVAATIEKIIKTDPPLLRACNERLPKDTEAIVFKCLEKPSENRYDRAELLKEDINNFLRSKPIKARPVGKIGRLLKWIKRNRLVSMLFGVLVILLITGLYAFLNSSIKESLVVGSDYIDEGKNLEAIKSYERALKLLNVPIFSKKTKAEVLTGMGDAWSGMGNYEKAINSYERALQIDNNDVSALSELGDVYFETGKYEKTIELYDKVLRLSPGHRDSYYQRGKAYKELGSYREALHDFQSAIRIAPNDLDTLKEISGVLLKMGLKSEDAQAVNLQKEGFKETEIKAILQLKDR
jgi:serine/threonine protein kinase/Tfp pilus assembly protein PilF